MEDRQPTPTLVWSSERDKIAAALVAACGEIENVTKDAENPHFRSRYATLAAGLDVIRPCFAKHGLALIQAPGVYDDGVPLSTVVLHSSGQFLEVSSWVPIDGKVNAQTYGSAVTYLRRYAAFAVAGIAPEDDDGNGATNAPPRDDQPTSRGKSQPTAKVTWAQVLDEGKRAGGVSELAIKMFLVDRFGLVPGGNNPPAMVDAALRGAIDWIRHDGGIIKEADEASPLAKKAMGVDSASMADVRAWIEGMTK